MLSLTEALRAFPSPMDAPRELREHDARSQQLGAEAIAFCEEGALYAAGGAHGAAYTMPLARLGTN